MQMAAKSPDDLEQVAEWVLEQIENNQSNVVAFYGPMGSGKTTLIAEIARQKQVTQTPSSPTFAIINDYSNESGEVIHHFDFYRIKNTEEAFDLGYQEYFYSDELCLIEWPELIEELLPENTLKIKIEPTSENSRLFTIDQ